MRGRGTSRTLSISYGVTIGLGVVLAGIAANLQFLQEAPVLVGLPLLVLGLHLWGAVDRRHLSGFQLSGLLSVFASSDSHLPGTLARLIFLVALPVLMGSMALYDDHQYAPFLNAYLIMLTFMATLEQQQHDALLLHVVTGTGFILLASLQASLGLFVLSGIAACVLLHGTSAYLLMLCYPDLDEAASRRISLLVLRRNLFVLLGAAVMALIGAGILHGTLYTTVWQVLRPGMERAITMPTDDTFGLSNLFGLITWLALSGAAAFIMVRMISAIIQQRRGFREGLMTRQVGDEANPRFAFRLFGLSREWEESRKQIITAYIKTRNGLGKMGYELKITATPNEYFRFVSRRLQHVQRDLAQLTELFLAARYAKETPSPEAAAQARALAHDILRKARREE